MPLRMLRVAWRSREVAAQVGGSKGSAPGRAHSVGPGALLSERGGQAQLLLWPAAGMQTDWRCSGIVLPYL